MAGNNDPDPVIEKYGRLSPEKIIELKREEIIGRLQFFEKIYNEYAGKWNGVYLNPYLLREAVESYYCDVYRLKFFRPVNRINEHKKAAYAMKWISRIRPIQLHDGIGPSASVIMVNAYFALVAGLSLLDIEYDVRNDDWWKSYITDTTYLLHTAVPRKRAHTAVLRVDSDGCVKKRFPAT